jgi:hypothetical protein
VAHDDRRPLQFGDDLGVVIDDLGDSELLQPGRVAPKLFEIALHAGPVAGDHAIAPALVPLDPLLPALGCQKQT